MKEVKHLVALVLTIALLVSIIVPVSAQTAGILQLLDSSMNEEVAVVMLAQEGAVRAHRLLISSFDWNEEKNDYDYPNHYGGDYISDNVLMIQLVNPTEADYAYYTELLEDYEGHFDFEEVDYSYNFLQAASEDTFEELNDELEITGYGVRMSQNSVILHVESDSLAATASAQADSSATTTGMNLPDYIQIQESSTVSTDSTLYGGDAICTSTSNWFTLGACGSYNGSVAIVTSGHDLTVGQTVYYGRQTTTTSIGTLQKVNYSNGLYGDYAIITVSSSHTLSKYIRNAAGYVLINTYDESPAEGTVVSRYGATSGYSTGIISDTNLTQNMGGVSVKGVTKVELSGSYTAQGGDSGGPYYYHDSSLGYVFCGVHSGHLNSDASIAYFTPYKYILRSGGFVVAT